MPFSHSSRSDAYPFFSDRPEGHVVINDCKSSEVNRAQSFFRTLRLLNRCRPDAVLACGYERPETLAAQTYARMHRLEGGAKPRAVLMVDNLFHDRRRRAGVEAMKSAYLQLFDGFITGGSRHRDYLLQLRVPSNRIKLGYDCVDNSSIQRMADAFRRSARSVAQQSKYFVCVARMVPQKNLAALVVAYEQYRRALPATEEPWRLVLCGDGPERPRILSLVDSAQLRAVVEFVGQTNRLEETVGYLAHASAFVLPSSVEPWGLVVNEAMASGLPVLVSRQCGCSPELVEDGQNGFTFDCDDPGELAGKMLWMHDHQIELPRMGRRSQEIVQRYSPETFAASVESLLL